MDNVDVSFVGGGTLSGNQAIGGASSAGNNGTGAGPDLFMHGSGVLRFQSWPGQPFTIQGGIADEAGTVKAGHATLVDGVIGGDGFASGGGTGAWNIQLQGSGTLVIQSQNWVSGTFQIAGGVLDLSGADTRGGCSVSLQAGTLSYRPADGGSGLVLGTLTIEGGSSLSINGLGCIHVDAVQCDAGPLQLSLDPEGFTVGTAVPVLVSAQPIDVGMTLTATAGFTCSVESNAILVTRAGA